MGWTSIIGRANGNKAPATLFLIALISVVLSYLASCLLQIPWQKELLFFHSVFEGACISVAVFTFLTMWQNYERCSHMNRLLGFGFLLAGFFDFMHTYYYHALIHHAPGFLDLSSRYWLLGRLTEGVTLILSTLNFSGRPKKRWMGLIFTITLGMTLSFAVHGGQELVPVLLTAGGRAITAKVGLELIIMGLFLLNIIRLYPAIKREESVNEKYMVIALMIAILAEKCLASDLSSFSFAFILGHVLKVSYYFYLYKGLFVATVSHPYRYYETILNELPLGIINYDSQETIRFVNDEAAKRIGAAQGELIGLNASDFEKRFYRNGEKCSIRNVSPDRKRFYNVLRTIERGADKVHLEISGFRFSQGGWLVYLTDTQMAQQIENLQVQTKTILNSMDSMVLVTDAGDRVTMCNNSFLHLTGLSEAEVINKGLSEVEDLLGLKFGKPGKGTSLHEGLEGSFQSKDGTYRDIILSLNSVKGSDGKIIGTVAVATDVSSVRKEAERLRQREKLAVLGQMAAGIGHEIRNPMTTVRGFLQLLGEKHQFSSQKSVLDLMISELDRANSIISEFLMLARGKQTNFKLQNLNDIIDHLYPLMEADAFTQNKQIRHLAEDIPNLQLNKNEISQLIMNLVRNGLEAMEAGGVLTIQTDFCHNNVLLTIADEGCGIPAEDLAKLGTPFFTTKDNGTGLGLATSFTIAEAHNAHVDIESGSEGTTFKISFSVPDQMQESNRRIS